jgi:hypothetical protein
VTAQPRSYAHPAALPDGEILADCVFTFLRRGGPGGQHRNKVETAAIVTHRPTDLSAEAGERRSQAENRRRALFRLRVKLALECRQSVAAKQAPSSLWQARCLRGRVSINPAHGDFPAILAEALDFVAGRDFDVRAAAAELGCTTSQLVKLLALEPRALAGVNAHRRLLGLKPLA